MLGALLLLGLLVPAAARATETENGAPAVRSASEVGYPPFCLVREDGAADGFSVELMRASLARMGREVTFRTGPWAEVRGWLEHGEVDALPMVGRTPEREALYDFTVPYLTMHGAIVVRTGTEDVRGLEDLRGRRVGVMQGDNAEEFLRREDRGLEIVTTATFEDAFVALAEERCGAVVVQRLVAIRLLQETGLAASLEIVARPVPGFAQDFCFAVREGDREMLALLNEGLALVVADGTHRRLHATWFAQLELPPDRPVVVGGDHAYPPFEFLDDKGRPTGFAVELTRAIAREMDIDVHIQLGPWASMVGALREGRIDALEGMFFSTERDRVLDFSPRYLVIHCVTVVRRGGGSPPTTLEDLEGRDLVVQAEDAILDVLAERGITVRVTTVATQEDVVRAVAEGRGACGLATRYGALHAIEKNGWATLEVGDQALYSGEYAYAVPQGNEALLAQFAEGLRVLKDSGEYQRLYEKWLGVYEPEGGFRTAFRYVAVIAAPILLLTLLALLWLWSLRRQVAARTRELRASEELQRAMITCSPVALYTVDMGGCVLTWNESCERIFGWSADEVVGRPLPIVPDDEAEEFVALRRAVLEGTAIVGRELERQRKGGERIHVNLSVAPVTDSRGGTVAIMGAAEDITERKRAEAEREKLQSQLTQAQKMESVGRLAGGVAHDFNNILQALGMNGEMLVDALPEGSETHGRATEIVDGVRRAATLTQQLLAFARKQTVSPRVLDLNETVASVLKMVRRLIGEGIDLAWVPGAGLWAVKVDPGQVDQILANLCINARDAIDGGGSVTVETDNVSFDEAYCAANTGFVPGDFVQLTVSDDGCGMDRETCAMVFEPFFTTKKAQQGTGLGLATVYGIVTQNGGFVIVSSEPGVGTTFKVYLPRHDGVPDGSSAVREGGAYRGCEEAVLLVEDDLALLRAAEKTLEILGYEVHAARTVAEALALADKLRGRAAVLLTDVVMPEMSGPELAAEVRRRCAGIRVLFMSGYTADVIAHRGVLDAGVHFIQKPFSGRSLGEKIRAMLDEARPVDLDEG